MYAVLTGMCEAQDIPRDIGYKPSPRSQITLLSYSAITTKLKSIGVFENTMQVEVHISATA